MLKHYFHYKIFIVYRVLSLESTVNLVVMQYIDKIWSLIHTGSDRPKEK